jgi:hypothetical protein
MILPILDKHWLSDKGKFGMPGCSPHPKLELRRKTDIIDTVMFGVVCDLPFSRNQGLISADE